MTGTIDTFTLISLIVLLVIVFKLRSVLGRHSSDDEARIKARNEERERAAAAARTSEKVITLPRRNRDEAQAPEPQAQTGGQSQAEAEERINGLAGADSAVRRGLLDILGADRDFNPDQFLKGARAAYEMIVTAFAEGDRDSLRGLLAERVFNEFSAAIGDRERRGETIEQKFVGINKADILEAELKGGAAEITVRFVSQLIKATRDKAGEIIDGEPNRVKDLTDIFTFRRDISSAKARQSPDWFLVETSSSN